MAAVMWPSGRIAVFLKAARLNPSVAFASPDHAASLASRSVQGGMVTILSQWSKFALGILTTIVLARLLTPDDFGLIGMVGVVVGLAETLRDAGLTSVTVQVRDIDQDQASSLFWANMLFLGVVGIAIVAASPLVARFYGRPELLAITMVLAGSFVLNGLSVQHEALLRRHMRFTALALAQVLAKVVALLVALGLALAGYRYWALVAGTLTAGVASTLLVFAFLPWVPGRARSGPEVGPLLRAGGDITILNMVGYIARNMDYILIGRFLGTGSLGQYSKAFELSMIPTSQIRMPVTDVALPALSALQADDERFVRYYRGFVAALAVLIAPISLLLATQAPFLVSVTLGPQWEGAVAPLRILAIAGLIQGLASTRGTVLMARGMTKRYLGLGIVTSFVTAVAFAVGLRWGITGVAYGYVGANALVLAPTLTYAFRGTPLSSGDFLAPAVKPVLFAVVAAGAGLASGFIPFTREAVGHLFAVAVFGIVYVALAWQDVGLREMARAVLVQSGLRKAAR